MPYFSISLHLVLIVALCICCASTLQHTCAEDSRNACGEGVAEFGIETAKVPLDVMEGVPKMFSWEEVARHRRTEPWIVIDGLVIDVSGFLRVHPGGRAKLLKYSGGDGSEAFHDEGHSEHATDVLRSLAIGHIMSTERDDANISINVLSDHNSCNRQTDAEESGASMDIVGCRDMRDQEWNKDRDVEVASVDSNATEAVRTVYSWEEVAQHRGTSEPWVVIDGLVINVSGFLNFHPGGHAKLLKYSGGDGSDAFHAEGHSEHATAILHSLAIGQVKDVAQSAANISLGALPDNNRVFSTHFQVAKFNFGAEFAYGRLFTTEDKLHIHKVLGTLALLSFITRLCVMLVGGATLRKPTTINVATLALHVLHGISAFQFPAKQMHDRWHANIFNMRNTIAIGLNWASHSADMYGPRRRTWRLARLANIVLCHMALDAATQYYNPGHVGGRGYGSALFANYVGLGQLGALLMALGMHGASGNSPQSVNDLIYSSTFPSQLDAFLRTLKRRDVISWDVLHVTYVLSIFPAHLFFVTSNSRTFNLVWVAMGILRFKTSLPKYVLYVLAAIASEVCFAFDHRGRDRKK